MKDLEDKCVWKSVCERDVYLYGARGQMPECVKCDGYNTECKAYKSLRQVHGRVKNEKRN